MGFANPFWAAVSSVTHPEGVPRWVTQGHSVPMPKDDLLSHNTVGFGDWLASLTGERSLEASLYAGLPNSRISTNQLYRGFIVEVLGVYEIPSAITIIYRM